MGYVYVMDRANGHLKIGFSQEPFRRLSQVAGAIKVLAVWAHDNARAAEAVAHRLLAAHRQDGEWFEVDRYTAFSAVASAFREQVAVPAAYEIPTPRAIQNSERHRLGYLRQIDDATAEQQRGWLLSSGVSELDIFTDPSGSVRGLDSSLKDCRYGDLYFAWSPRVFGDRASMVPGLVAQRGAELVVAM